MDEIKKLAEPFYVWIYFPGDAPKGEFHEAVVLIAFTRMGHVCLVKSDAAIATFEDLHRVDSAMPEDVDAYEAAWEHGDWMERFVGANRLWADGSDLHTRSLWFQTDKGRFQGYVATTRSMAWPDIRLIAQGVADHLGTGTLPFRKPTWEELLALRAETDLPQ